MKTFSKKIALTYGWYRFKERPFFVIGLFLITIAISVLTGTIADKFSYGSVGVIVNLIDFSIQILLGMGMTLILLRLYDKVDTDYTDLIEPFHLFWKYLAMTILVLAVIAVGLILFIIPGIIAAIALSFTTYLVIDRNLGPVEAMQESLRITQGHRWNLFIFGLSLFFLNILGALLAGVGLLVTIPVSALAIVHVYRWLLNPPDEADAEVSQFAKMISAFLLLIIIGGIIVILMATSSTSVFSSPKGRDIQRRADLMDIKISAAEYFNVNGVFPASLNQLIPQYIETTPNDPLNGKIYKYTQYAEGADYEVCAKLETKNQSNGIYCEYGLDFGPNGDTVTK